MEELLRLLALLAPAQSTQTQPGTLQSSAVPLAQIALATGARSDTRGSFAPTPQIALPDASGTALTPPQGPVGPNPLDPASQAASDRAVGASGAILGEALGAPVLNAILGRLVPFLTRLGPIREFRPPSSLANPERTIGGPDFLTPTFLRNAPAPAPARSISELIQLAEELTDAGQPGRAAEAIDVIVKRLEAKGVTPGGTIRPPTLLSERASGLHGAEPIVSAPESPLSIAPPANRPSANRPLPRSSRLPSELQQIGRGDLPPGLDELAPDPGLLDAINRDIANEANDPVRRLLDDMFGPVRSDVSGANVAPFIQSPVLDGRFRAASGIPPLDPFVSTPPSAGGVGPNQTAPGADAFVQALLDAIRRGFGPQRGRP